MSYRRNGRGLLGLLTVAVLGLMAFAASAQGVTPEFTINGATALHASVTGEQEGVLSFLVEKANLTIKCNTFEVKEGLILTGEDADLKLLYKECKAFEFKAPFAELPCHVSDVAAGKPELLHITASYLLLPVEFASGDYGILFEKFVLQVNFLSGLGCPLPLKNVTTGELCSLIEPATNDTVEPLILFSRAIQEACPLRKILEGLTKLEAKDEPEVERTVKDKLLFGSIETFVDGAVKIKLTGVHAGLTLGVLLL